MSISGALYMFTSLQVLIAVKGPDVLSGHMTNSISLQRGEMQWDAGVCQVAVQCNSSAAPANWVSCPRPLLVVFVTRLPALTRRPLAVDDLPAVVAFRMKRLP